MRFIDEFSVILLDMNGTFMFGHDRFGPEEDYFATYQALGGQGLNRVTLHEIVRTTGNALLREYERPERFEDFPTLEESFREFGGAPHEELEILERLFAAHEIGSVPETHASFLRQLATSHHLGIVSNICAKPEPWLEQLGNAGLLPLFKTIVFSSEGRSIKPSRKLFERALAGLPAFSRVLFVGDSLERDIVPAKALNLSTAWIAPSGSKDPAADVVVQNLTELAELAVPVST